MNHRILYTINDQIMFFKRNNHELHNLVTPSNVRRHEYIEVKAIKRIER